MSRCIVCRYDLTGLPASHACPECGFEYDETMMVWSTPRALEGHANQHDTRQARYGAMLGYLGIGLSVLGMTMSTFRPTFPPTSTSQRYMPLLFCGVLLLAALGMRYLTRHRPSFVAVSNGAVAYRRLLRPARCVRFADIVNVKALPPVAEYDFQGERRSVTLARQWATTEESTEIGRQLAARWREWRKTHTSQGR